MRKTRILTCYLSPDHLLLGSENLKWTYVGTPEKEMQTYSEK